MADTQKKVEVIALKTFEHNKKRYPMWRHYEFSVSVAKSLVEKGFVKYAD